MSQNSLSYVDKLLPVQPELSKYFDGDNKEFLNALYNTMARFSNVESLTECFRMEQSEQFSLEEMASSPIQLKFLQSLILLGGYKQVLEIGTFIGFSTMCLASVIPEGGKIVTIEKYDNFADIARRNFSQNNLDDKIQLIVGDAIDALKEFKKQSFDMIYLDANKERYDEYFEPLDVLLKPNGLLVVDDVFFHGDVLNGVPKTEKGQGVLKFLELVQANQNYHKTVLPVGNGVMLMVKCAPNRGRRKHGSFSPEVRAT